MDVKGKYAQLCANAYIGITAPQNYYTGGLSAASRARIQPARARQIQPGYPGPSPVQMSGGAQSARGKAGPDVSPELEKKLERVKKELSGDRREIHCSFDKEANGVVIEVVNPDTDEVIRQIPSEEAVRNIARIRELSASVIDKAL